MNAQERVQRAKSDLAHLEGRQAATQAESDGLVTAIGAARARLELRPDVDAVLLTLQERSHQRTVGMYEQLLTKLLQEVLPNETKAIGVDLSTSSGQSTVSFMVERRPDGQREDLLAGSGGSVANVVSAGLRFIALSRTALRRFVVFDEADCWLAPTRVSAFANVIAGMGADLGTQSLMISHHDPELFASCGSIVQLGRTETGDLRATPRFIREAPRPDQLAWIRLVNFMSHSDTQVPLSAGLTVLVGQNDVGKSAIVTAIAAASGIRTFKKEFVRHGCDSASVILGFGDGRVLECTRSAKGSPAMMYRLFAADGNMLHETPSAEPDWLPGTLGIHTEGGLDIQVGNQKQPVFLLNEPGSKQAAILSIGKESSLISVMQAEYKSLLAKDRALVKSGEAKLTELTETLQKMQGIQGCAEILAEAETALRASEQSGLAATQLGQLINRLAPAQAASEPLAQLLLLTTPAVPALQDTSRLIELGRTLGQLSPWTNLALPLQPTVMPELHDTEHLAGVLGKLETLSKQMIAVPQGPAACLPPENIQAGLQLLQSLQQAGEQLAAAHTELLGVETAIRQVTAEQEALVTDLGGVCPLCGSPSLGEHLHAA